MRRTTLIPSVPLALSALVLFAPAVAFSTLPFLYGPLALFTWRYDSYAVCVLRPRVDLTAGHARFQFTPMDASRKSGTNAAVPVAAVAATSKTTARRLLVDGAMGQATVPNTGTPTAPIRFRHTVAAAKFYRNGGGAVGPSPLRKPQVHGWQFRPSKSTRRNAFTATPSVFDAEMDSAAPTTPDNFAEHLLAFLLVLGMCGSGVGAGWIYIMVAHCLQRVGPAVLDQTGTSVDVHKSGSLERWNPSKSQKRTIFCAIVLMVLLQLYIVAGTIWAFGQGGTACANQGGVATLLIEHSRTYLVSLWSGGGLIAIMICALMLMHRAWFEPYFVELNMGLSF